MGLKNKILSLKNIRDLNVEREKMLPSLLHVERLLEGKWNGEERDKTSLDETEGIS